MIKNLIDIQNELKAPKSSYNDFGKYAYRSAEDILTAVKPLLKKYGAQLTLSDEIVSIGDRVYIKAVATLTDADGNTQTTTAYAREAATKKGMDESQITGTASSYARKYCLNGLFLIDDTKDADTNAYHEQTHQSEQPQITVENKAEYVKQGSEKITADEVEKLTAACAQKGEGWLEKAMKACRVKKITSISRTQYRALMAQLGAAA